MKPIILHYAVPMVKYGETRIRSLCNRSRVDIIDINSIDSGQNVTGDPKSVTCKFCLRILPARLKFERGER
jgi:hypothetical protein